MDFVAYDTILFPPFPRSYWWAPYHEFVVAAIYEFSNVFLPIHAWRSRQLYIPPFLTAGAESHAHGFIPLQKGQAEFAGLAIYVFQHLLHWYSLFVCQ